MDIQTSRFGTIAIEVEDILVFPNGLLGLEDCQHWVLLADAQNDALGWLQSTSRPEIALAVVTPAGLCRTTRCASCARIWLR